jgi:cytochrome c
MDLRPALLLLVLLAAPTLASAQNAAAGQRVFNQCRACQMVDQVGWNGVGPSLHGVFGRRADAVDGFRHSAPVRARAADGLTGDEATLHAYIADPNAVAPARFMTLASLRTEHRLNDLIAYLRQATGAR